MAQKFFAPYLKSDQKEDYEKGTAPGYYLVRESDGKRFFISKVVDIYAMNEICQHVLSDETGWTYSVARSFGKDSNGDPMWSSIDHTTRFV